MPDQDQIFRKAALDRLSSPEQLDQLMQVATPKSWLALLACCVLVLITVAWGIWGTIPTKVHGRGILVKQGGVFLATARGDGIVSEIPAQETPVVAKDQLLVRLRIPELDLKIKQATLLHSNLLSELNLLRAYQKQEAQSEAGDTDAELAHYQAMIRDYGAQIDALQNRISGLTAPGMADLFPMPFLLDVTNNLLSTQHELARTRVQIKQLEVNQIQAKERRRQQMLDKQLQLYQQAQELEYLSNTYRLTSEIRSPFTGEVLEVMVKTNQMVGAGSPLVSLQAEREKLQAWLFLPPADGKRVRKDMEVQLSPVSVKKEVDGLLLGRVDSVSAFPATPQLLLRILENPALVAEFSQEGAPMAVVVDLMAEDNESGFRWTSGRGPRTRITSGTLCDGSVTLTNRRPISLVLPLVKDVTGF